MNKKHIAFISIGGLGTGAFSQGIPIINSFIQTIAQSYHVTVFSLHPINRDFFPKGYRLIGPNQQSSFIRKFSWLLSAFFKENRKRKINLIHSFWGFPSGVFGVVLKKIFQIPVIIHLQGSDAVALPEINYGIFNDSRKKWMINWAYKNVDELIALTNYQKNKLRVHFNEKTPKVIPFGVDVSVFKVNSPHKELQAPFKFIHIAHINNVKDQRTLLDVFKLICNHLDAELKIFGTDTLSGAIQSYASKIGIKDKVHFCGIVPNEELVDHLAQAHVLLHTSLYEAQAVSVSEAIASGVVVCGTCVGIIADLDQICTISSPIGDAQTLASNVLDLLADKDRYKKIVEAGILWSLENDQEHTISAFKKVYSKYLNSSSADMNYEK